jgi:hypothetical protein
MPRLGENSDSLLYMLSIDSLIQEHAANVPSSPIALMSHEDFLRGMNVPSNDSSILPWQSQALTQALLQPTVLERPPASSNEDEETEPSPKQ